MTLKVKVFHLVVHFPLLVEMIFDIPRLANIKIDDVNYYVGFKKRPKQIVDNFVTLKKRDDAFGCEDIDRLYEVDQ